VKFERFLIFVIFVIFVIFELFVTFKVLLFVAVLLTYVLFYFEMRLLLRLLMGTCCLVVFVP